MSAPIKTLVLRGARQAPSMMQSCPRAAFSTMPARAAVKTAPVARQLSKAAVSSPRILITAKASRHAAAVATTTRFFSSTPTAAAATAPSSTGSAASTAALDWNSFFQLRVKRRRIQMVFSIFSGIMSGAAGAVVLSSGAADTLVGMVPLDPFATLGIATVCAGGIGWLVGPSIGSQLFYLLNRRYKTQMLEKESEFLTRVKKHRSDPTNSSTSNPVPDFYGEKISSVSGYRRWLKDQRAFNRKKNANFV